MKSAPLAWAVLLTLLAFAGLLALGLLLPDGGGGIELGARAVGVLEISGPIDDPAQALRDLEYLRRERRVKALVVRVDSPGGEVAASQEIHAALLRFRTETALPVVASFGGVAASGGYYIACAADRIVANPGTLTGSIGVILTYANAEGLLERVGIRFRSVQSGQMKDQGAFWRDLTDEERAVLQGTVDDVYDQFLEVVEQGRGMSREEIAPYADGRTLSGRQARQAGLVDSLGDLSVAIDLAKSLGGLDEDAPVHRPRKPREGILDRLLEGSAALPALLEPGVRIEYRLAPHLGGGVVGGRAR